MNSFSRTSHFYNRLRFISTAPLVAIALAQLTWRWISRGAWKYVVMSVQIATNTFISGVYPGTSEEAHEMGIFSCTNPRWVSVIQWSDALWCLLTNPPVENGHCVLRVRKMIETILHAKITHLDASGMRLVLKPWTHPEASNGDILAAHQDEYVQGTMVNAKSDTFSIVPDECVYMAYQLDSVVQAPPLHNVSCIWPKLRPILATTKMLANSIS